MLQRRLEQNNVLHFFLIFFFLCSTIKQSCSTLCTTWDWLAGSGVFIDSTKPTNPGMLGKSKLVWIGVYILSRGATTLEGRKRFCSSSLISGSSSGLIDANCGNQWLRDPSDDAAAVKRSKSAFQTKTLLRPLREINTNAALMLKCLHTHKGPWWIFLKSPQNDRILMSCFFTGTSSAHPGSSGGDG